ncbi:surface antigen [Aquamicrobium terrae]
MMIRVALLSGLLAMAGCSTTGSGRGATVSPGQVDIGGKPGPVSVLGGGLVAGTIGAGLTTGDKRKALEAEYKALEYTAGGQKVAWSGDQAGHRGEVVAAQPYRVGSQDCRQYTQTVFTGAGAGATARGTACRNPNGSWTPLT